MHGDRSISLRSIAIGLAGSAVLSGLAYFNDYVLNNSALLGSHLPAMVVLLLVLLSLGNALLRRLRPGAALGAGEIAVALGMILVACALPPAGLMRYLPGHLVGVVAQAGDRYETRQFLRELNLPDWIFPSFDSPADDLVGRAGEDVVRHFTARGPAVNSSSSSWWTIVPWSRWVTPALTWGLLLAFLYGAILALAAIVQAQWSRNERLMFPLATVYVALIEPPESPGRSLNRLFSSRSFWLSAAAVFLLHAGGALHQYAPRWPAIPLGFDLRGVLTEPPWSWAEWPLKRATIYFTVVGITFFVQSRTAFSLWFFYVLLNVAKMLYGAHGATLTGAMQTDQLFGALIVFAAAIAWTGRGHWMAVAGGMIAPLLRRRSKTTNGANALAGWMLLTCTAGVIGWLIAAGATPAGALVLTMMLLAVMLVLARIVAETGMIVVEFPVLLNTPWTCALQSLPAGLATRTSLRSYFYGALFQALFATDPRQCLSVLATHALEVRDRVAGASAGAARNLSSQTALASALAGALLVAYLSAGASALYCEYSYSSTLDALQKTPINAWGTLDSVQSETIGRSIVFREPGNGPPATHSHAAHFAFGALLTGALLALRWTFSGWPLHPVGFLLAYSSPIQQIWFSVLVGWLAKVVLVKLGGGDLVVRARAAFIGLIVGESLASAFWLIVSLARLSMGLHYEAIQLLPAG